MKRGRQALTAAITGARSAPHSAAASPLPSLSGSAAPPRAASPSPSPSSSRVSRAAAATASANNSNSSNTTTTNTAAPPPPPPPSPPISSAPPPRRHRPRFTQPGLRRLQLAVYAPPPPPDAFRVVDPSTASSFAFLSAATTTTTPTPTITSANTSAAVGGDSEPPGSNLRAHKQHSRREQQQQQRQRQRQPRMLTAAAARGRAQQAIAIGGVVAQLSETVFAVSFANSNKSNNSGDGDGSVGAPPLLPYIDVGARVYATYERTDDPGSSNRSPASSLSNNSNGNSKSTNNSSNKRSNLLLVGGTVVKINMNGTFGVLLDNNKLDLAVPRDRLELASNLYKAPRAASVSAAARLTRGQSGSDKQITTAAGNTSSSTTTTSDNRGTRLCNSSGAGEGPHAADSSVNHAIVKSQNSSHIDKKCDRRGGGEEKETLSANRSAHDEPTTRHAGYDSRSAHDDNGDGNCVDKDADKDVDDDDDDGFDDTGAKFMRSPAFLDMVVWLRSAGLRTLDEQQSTAAILYLRGWRARRLYLLEAGDVAQLTHLSKSARLSLAEKAEWQRDHHRQMRIIYKERVKEKDWRHFCSKYAGLLSATVAFIGAGSLFGWNYKNYLKQQRSYQMQFAVKALATPVHTGVAGGGGAAGWRLRAQLRRANATAASSSSGAAAAAASTATSSSSGSSASNTSTSSSSNGGSGANASPTGGGTGGAAAAGGGGGSAGAAAAATAANNNNSNNNNNNNNNGGGGGVIARQYEEHWIRRILAQLDTAHPRIAVFTGLFGCGKSTLLRVALAKEGMTGVLVDVRTREGALRCVIKALGVPFVDACGDPLDFVSEACMRASEQMGGKTPVIVLKLREGDNLSHVYSEAVSLACDRRVCHLVIEVPLESLTMSNTSLPRLDFYTVPNFNLRQAFQYAQHSIDPVELSHFFELVGTNSSVLDELFAAVHQRNIPASEYANQMLIKAMRQVQAAVAGRPQLRAAIRQLARFPYDQGQPEGLDDSSLSSPLLKDIVLYDPVRDVWLFNNGVLHSAARCCML